MAARAASALSSAATVHDRRLRAPHRLHGHIVGTRGGDLREFALGSRLDVGEACRPGRIEVASGYMNNLVSMSVIEEVSRIR